MIPDLWQVVYNGVLASRVNELVELLAGEISSTSPHEFASVAESKITNDVSATAESINHFIEFNSKNYEVKSIYLEMNGFDINYDRWYFDFFAYDKYVEDSDDLDWLCYWQSADWPDTTIIGMEDAQRVFEWYHEKKIWNTNPEQKDMYDATRLLVMLRFMEFTDKVVSSKKLIAPVPVCCTAHGFESAYRIAH